MTVLLRSCIDTSNVILSCTASKLHFSFVLYRVHSFYTALLFVEGLMLIYVRFCIVPSWIDIFFGGVFNETISSDSLVYIRIFELQIADICSWITKFGLLLRVQLQDPFVKKVAITIFIIFKSKWNNISLKFIAPLPPAPQKRNHKYFVVGPLLQEDGVDWWNDKLTNFHPYFTILTQHLTFCTCKSKQCDHGDSCF